jgi:hypothetical protein
MGANWFRTYGMGNSVKEAYNSAVEDAEQQYGHQEGYSGEINCSSGFRDVTKEFKASGKSLNDYIDQMADKLTKHQGAQAICISEPVSNKNKIKTQVEHIVTPGTKKWVLMYVVYCQYDRIMSAVTKGEAVKLAREYSENNQCTTTIRMERVLEKKDHSLVAKVTYKRASDEREGKWLFFGWASY